MGLFDKLTGSRAGNPGVAPVPTGELRSALIALGNGDWQVRDGGARLRPGGRLGTPPSSRTWAQARAA